MINTFFDNSNMIDNDDNHTILLVLVFVTDDNAEGLSAVPAPWEDSRLDERIYADTPNYLTFQLNSKRYSVPYHPVARLRASQTAGVVLPYAMIANRNYVNDDANRFEPVWKPTAAELLTVLMNRRKNTDTGMDNTNFMRFGIIILLSRQSFQKSKIYSA
ncbi:Uncharacterized protein FWK35_00019815 [Aphis craccivora]|uniref:Uncharacterized protein n=1 Tax=Aphis craccivora TaxID=307492 RepID=A0A6G0ZFZ7_APHCR|nr:Uncharacterized protein FWK35_00019815 [Aphis craccivora]